MLGNFNHAPNASDRLSTSRSTPFRLRVDDTVLFPGPLRSSMALPVATCNRPRLSWVVPLTRNDQTQTGYHIVASSASVKRPTGESDLWDSGIVDSDQNYGIIWGGQALTAGTTVKWSVRVRDDRSTLSHWSEGVQFVTPPLQASDWAAQWISVPATKAALVHFDISVPSDRAILHFAAQGWMRAVIDGHVVNSDARDPCDTARIRAVSRSYDVTPYLDQTHSSHVIGFVGALGHHHEVLDAPRLLAELICTSCDGETKRIVTSGEWSIAPTSLLVESPFFAEVHDVTCGDDWMYPGSDRERWAPASLISSSSAARFPLPKAVTPDAGPPIRVVEERSAVRVPSACASTPDIQIFDVGDNVAARSVIHLSGTLSGQKVMVAHGEMLDPDGRVDTTNIHLPWGNEEERQVIEWICAGGDDEVIEPWFSIFGFRYIEVRGVEGARVDWVIARVIHSDVEVVGSFSSSDHLIDRLVRQAVRTQLNNTHGHPEDCPSREQGGWTGDASVSAEAALSHLDMTGVYRNWLADVAGDQTDHGGILGLTPFVMADKARQPVDPVWGAAMTEIPWQMWQHTGDVNALATLLPAMRRWCDWQLGTIDGGVVKHADISFGADWLAQKQTPPVMLQTAAVIRSLRALADIEEVRCEYDCAKSRREQAQKLIQSARVALWDEEESVWGNASQASYAVALASGLVEDGERAAIHCRLEQAIKEHDGRLSTGFAGTQSVVRALSEMKAGKHILHHLLHDPTQPGAGAMLVDGPGTFWEMWWIDQNQVGTASLDHIGLAAPFSAWAWRYLAGLRPIEAGYRLFSVDLRSSSLLESLDVKLMTVRGEIRVQWLRTSDQMDLRVVVPVGAEALVIPSEETSAIEGGGLQEKTFTSHDRGLRLRSGHHRLILHTASEPQRPSSPTLPWRKARGGFWLSGLNDIDRWSTSHSHSSVRRIRDRWLCSPVFHESVDGDILEANHCELSADEVRWICLRFEEPLDLGHSRFIFAHVDVDNGVLPGRVVRPMLRVTSALAGTQCESTTRVMPVCWNRVAVDMADWAGRTAVSEVAVGVWWSKQHDVARGADVEPPTGAVDFTMMISRVGHSSAKRTY